VARLEVPRLAPDVRLELQTLGKPEKKALQVDDLARQARQPQGQLFARYEAPGEKLPARSVYVAPIYDSEARSSEETFALVAQGVVDGKGYILTVRGPAGRTRSRAALARLERIADSFVAVGPR
jgi:hypothetical protein